MTTAKTIAEMQFIEGDLEKGEDLYWNFSPAFIYAYYKTFELLGYEDSKERDLCEKQVELLQKNLSNYEFYGAKIEGTALSKKIISRYNTGFDGLDDVLKIFAV